MMTLLAKALGWFTGSGLATPISLIVALTMAHQAWLARDNRVEERGEQRCEAEHHLAVARAERDQAKRAVEKAMQIIEQEKQLTETMRHDRQAITREFAAYKDRASADPRCLSDGVLDLLRGHGQVGELGAKR